MLGGVSAGAFTVFEHKGRVVTYLAHERERELVVFLSLTVVAHEDVGGKTTVGDDAADGLHTVHIPLAGVFAVHEFQDAVAATLHRQMDMFADVGLLGDDMQGFVAHVLGVRGSEAHPHPGSLVGH